MSIHFLVLIRCSVTINVLTHICVCHSRVRYHCHWQRLCLLKVQQKFRDHCRKFWIILLVIVAQAQINEKTVFISENRLLPRSPSHRDSPHHSFDTETIFEQRKTANWTSVLSWQHRRCQECSDCVWHSGEPDVQTVKLPSDGGEKPESLQFHTCVFREVTKSTALANPQDIYRNTPQK